MEAFSKKVEAAHALAWYRPGREVVARDRMQRYAYTLAEPPGTNFAKGFRPHASPARMLALGVFEGKYLTDGTGEFPREWFERMVARGRIRFAGARSVADPSLNAFGVKSRLSLGEWRRRGWIPAAAGDRDVRGWFQWYCRYWLGRRQPAVDAVQIARWRSFARHKGQILASYRRLGRDRPRTAAEKRAHRPRQRQALLQWAYNPFI